MRLRRHGTTIYTLQWEWAKRPVDGGEGWTDPTFTFTPVDQGTYAVTLSVTDDDGATVNDDVVITVSDAAPTVVLHGDATVPVGSHYVLTIGPIADPGADAVMEYRVSWGDGTPIKTVQVQLDSGEWRDAKLDEKPLEKYCWRFFSIDLGPVAAGKHTLVSRGVDANGRVQPSAQDDEIALKRTYWEAYQQWPRTIQVEA
jgi:hypothetical protein